MQKARYKSGLFSILVGLGHYSPASWLTLRAVTCDDLVSRKALGSNWPVLICLSQNAKSPL